MLRPVERIPPLGMKWVERIDISITVMGINNFIFFMPLSFYRYYNYLPRVLSKVGMINSYFYFSQN